MQDALYKHTNIYIYIYIYIARIYIHKQTLSIRSHEYSCTCTQACVHEEDVYATHADRVHAHNEVVQCT